MERSVQTRSIYTIREIYGFKKAPLNLISYLLTLWFLIIMIRFLLNYKTKLTLQELQESKLFVVRKLTTLLLICLKSILYLSLSIHDS